MILKKALPPPFRNRKLLVSTLAYRRYWTHSLNSIHNDIFSAIEEWVKVGSVVWDIGANCGVFSYAAAVRAGSAGTVYAVEADVQCAALIDRSRAYRLDDEAPVVLCPFAVSNEDGVTDFVVSNYRSAASSLAGYGRFDSGGTLKSVPSLRLDSLSLNFLRPDLVKIDVEGAEHLVLGGGRELLVKARPVLLCECSPGPIGGEVLEILKQSRYLWRPMCRQSGQQFTDGPITTSDIVALPIEMCQGILRA